MPARFAAARTLSFIRKQTIALLTFDVPWSLSKPAASRSICPTAESVACRSTSTMRNEPVESVKRRSVLPVGIVCSEEWNTRPGSSFSAIAPESFHERLLHLPRQFYQIWAASPSRMKSRQERCSSAPRPCTEKRTPASDLRRHPAR